MSEEVKIKTPGMRSGQLYAARRDLFAAAALQGLIVVHGQEERSALGAEIVETAWKLADHMLKEEPRDE